MIGLFQLVGLIVAVYGTIRLVGDLLRDCEPASPKCRDWRIILTAIGAFALVCLAIMLVSWQPQFVPSNLK